MKLPDFVAGIGLDEQGKHHAFYNDPLDGSRMMGPARDTEAEAQADQYEVLAMFKRIGTENGLVVGDIGDGKTH